MQKNDALAAESQRKQTKLATCARMQLAIESASRYVRYPKIYVVTVSMDADLGLLRCVNVSGEEVITAQELDVTIGNLILALSEVAPDHYVQLVSQNGTLLEGTNDDLVKACMGLEEICIR